MDEATKAKLKAAGLEGVITAFETMDGTLTKTKKDLETAQAAITEKDAIIEQKTKDIVGIRHENTKLKELTKEEKEKMSQKEIELHDATLALQLKQENFEKTQAESLKREVDARRNRAIDKIVGTKDPELRKKVEDAFGKIKDSDKAQTDEEIAVYAGQAFNMLGVPKPDPVREVINGGSGAPAGSEGNGFAEKPEAVALAGLMGLPTQEPKK